jgi:integrase
MDFEGYLYKIGRKKSTIKKHLIRLRVINRKLEKWNIEQVDEFIVSLKKSGIKNVTINSYIDTIRLFSQYSNYPNALCSYKHYKPDLSVKGTFSDEEIEKIITLPCPIGSDRKVWDKYSLIYSILAYSGMRPQEVCQLRKDSIDWGKNVFSIEHTKTGVPRFVPIPPNLANTIKEYVSSIDTQELFLSQRNEVISVKSYYHDFRKRLKICNIDRPHISVYSFRHSYITDLLSADLNIYKIAKLVGHSVTQTATYEHLTTKDLQLAIMKHPVVRKSSDPEYILKEVKQYIDSFELDKDERFEYSVTQTEKALQVRINLKYRAS